VFWDIGILGYWDERSGLRVFGLGFIIYEFDAWFGPQLRVHGSEFKVQGSGFATLDWRFTCSGRPSSRSITSTASCS
jgi:hypothetical protein